MIQNKQLEAKHKLMQLAETVLQKRYQILINSTTKNTIEYFQIQYIRESFIKNISQLDILSYNVVMFQVSLIINGTKCFEAFSLNKDGERTEPDHELVSETFSIKYNQPYLKIIWLIEYQLIENLQRWFVNSHILSISPERNQNLRIENNQMIGSGNFYLTNAHKYKNKFQNPFQLNYQHQIGFR